MNITELFLNGFVVLMALTTGYFLEKNKRRIALISAILCVSIITIAHWVDWLTMVFTIAMFVVMATISKLLFQKA